MLSIAIWRANVLFWKRKKNRCPICGTESAPKHDIWREHEYCKDCCRNVELKMAWEEYRNTISNGRFSFYIASLCILALVVIQGGPYSIGELWWWLLIIGPSLNACANMMTAIKEKIKERSLRNDIFIHLLKG